MMQHCESVLTPREVGAELGRMFRATNNNGDLDEPGKILSFTALTFLQSIAERPANLIKTFAEPQPRKTRDILVERVEASDIDTGRFVELLRAGAGYLSSGIYDDICEYRAGIMSGYNAAYWIERQETEDRK